MMPDSKMFPQFDDLLQSTGFNNVEVREEPTPIGTWPKDKRLKVIGGYFRYQFITAAVEGYSLALSLVSEARRWMRHKCFWLLCVRRSWAIPCMFHTLVGPPYEPELGFSSALWQFPLTTSQLLCHRTKAGAVVTQITRLSHLP